MAQVILHPREGRSARDYVLLYVGLGWKVFPVWNVVGEDEARACACGLGAACDRPGKHPIADLVPGGLNDASSERGDVERWWGARPEASIGIVTGRASGITVVDADASDGKPGVVNLTTICAEHGGVPSTFAVNTGGGGIHLYFKYSDALGTGNNVLAEAIDVRNDGGYVIAPPSGHMLGTYRWRQDSAELIELPAWLRSARQAAAETRRGRGRPRTKAAMRIEKAEAMLRHVDPEDRDIWLKIGVVLGRMYVGTPGENEGWALYEAWAARSEKFDEHRAENLQRMKEMFYEQSQAAPRAGAEPLGPGTLVALAREGGWSPFGDRAAVAYEPGNEALMCEQLIAALVANPEKNRFFNVMGEVRDVLRTTVASVHVIQHAAAQGRQTPEYLQVRRATVSGLQCALSEVAVLASVGRSGEPVAKPIPENLASMMLRDRARDFPTLSGIAEWPMVGSGGEVLFRQRGHDAGTGLYFDIDPEVRITEISADRAWKALCEEFLVDFPFDSDIHRAGALAMLLCFMQRPLMKTCPAFAVIAPQSKSGKSTLVEVASLAIHGQSIITHSFSNEEEELRKALHSLMLSKLPAVLFDNVGRGKAVYSDHLAKLLTSETSADRTLGASETKKEVNSLLMTFTGNNIAFVKDMSSRVVTIKLNARTADPMRRAFRHPDIKVYAREHRSDVLSALVAIARLADGSRPAGGISRFEDYDRMIVKPVLEVTGIDVRLLDVVVDVDAEEDETTRDVLAATFKWQQQLRGPKNGQGWRASELVQAIAERALPDEAISTIKRWSGSQRWENDAARALGYALRSVKDDYKFTPYLLSAVPEHDGVRWKVSGGSETVVATEERPF